MELAHKLNMDPFELRLKNTVQEGDVMPAYYGGCQHQLRRWTAALL